MIKILLLMGFILLKFNCFAVTWTSEQDISEANAESSKVVIDGSGNAIAAWIRFNGSTQVIETATYTGNWSAAVELSDAAFNANFQDIALNNSGDTGLAIWQLNNGTNFIIQVAVYSGGTWGNAQTLSTSGLNAFEPRVAINSQGDGFAIWIESATTTDVVMVSQFSNGVFGTPQVLSSLVLGSKTPVVAISDSGIGIAAWMSNDFVSNIFTIEGAIYNQGVWSSGETLSGPGENSHFPQIVINSTGVGFAIWERDNDPILLDAIIVALFDGVSWESEFVISDPSFNTSFPSIAINDSGNAIAGWKNASLIPSAGAAVYASGVWQSPEVISSEPVNSLVKVGIDGSDNTIAIWSEGTGETSIANYAENFLGINQWSLPEFFSNVQHTAASPKVAVNAAGDAVAVWDGFNGTDFVIQAVIGVP